MCAETGQQTKCNHSDQERMLHGTWVSLEIYAAVQQGYKVH